jgi:hypothetical protein
MNITLRKLQETGAVTQCHGGLQGKNSTESMHQDNGQFLMEDREREREACLVQLRCGNKFTVQISWSCKTPTPTPWMNRRTGTR